MPVRTELSDKWVRAYVGETAVVDSRAPVLCKVAFYNELVDITVEDMPQQRPVSVFSQAANCPA